MRALVCVGPEEGFRPMEMPVPTPGEGQVRIRVEACGINPVDVGTPRWVHQVDTVHSQGCVIPGLDVAGTIDALGKGVKGHKEGDRVVCHGYRFRSWGGFAEYSLQPANGLVALPKNVAMIDAAATPCAGWTAWRALVDRLRIEKGQSIVVAGGAGGVGSFALQICRLFELDPIVATCSAANEEHVRAMGATHVLDYRDPDLAAKVRELTSGAGVRKGLDGGAGNSDIQVADSLGFEGEMVLLSRLARSSSYQEPFSRALGIFQISLGDAHGAGPKAMSDLVAAGTKFTELLRDRVVTVPLNRVVDLEGVPAVLEELRERKVWGKAVATLV
ncbi:MAG: zinc-binding dehydrogenase [Fibrobacteria bacterium]|nr:zinc-binding dehydrogenase [Fibrobacteria bacterium]